MFLLTTECFIYRDQILEFKIPNLIKIFNKSILYRKHYD